MDLVSVIMPYYKKSETVSDTIASIIAQTYENFELLIVYDDPSKEDLSLLYSDLSAYIIIPSSDITLTLFIALITLPSSNNKISDASKLNSFE